MGTTLAYDQQRTPIDDSALGARRVAARVMEAIGARDSYHANSVLGVVGTGAAGAAVAGRGLAAGRRVVAARRPGAPAALEGVATASSLVGLIAASDHLVLACPRTVAELPEIDGDMLDYAKPSLHLIDVAYGTLVDRRTLLCALLLGKIGAVTLPRPDPDEAVEPLWRQPQVKLAERIEIGSTLATLARYHRPRAPERADW